MDVVAVAELRGKTAKELNILLDEVREVHFKCLAQLRSRQLRETHTVRLTRRYLARIKMVLGEKDILMELEMLEAATTDQNNAQSSK